VTGGVDPLAQAFGTVAAALEEIAAALDRHLAPGATVAVPYRTDVHWALRRPEP
jgi:hypothetical protein